MGRGRPAVWSTLLGLPFIGLGVVIYLHGLQFLQLLGISTSLLQSPESVRIFGGLPLVGFGIFIILIGLYVRIVSPDDPRLSDDERMIETRYPSQRVAFSKVLFCAPFFAISGYLLIFTFMPYVYPTATFAIGLYYFSTGMKTYWKNTLTEYYITNKRVMSEYRFLSLSRKELPLNKLRGVEERKSIIETLVGLGNIRVASGGGGGSVELVIRNIEDSSAFADRVRSLSRQ